MASGLHRFGLGHRIDSTLSLSSYERRVSCGVHSQPPMGSALQASQAVEIKRTRPKGIGRS